MNLKDLSEQQREAFLDLLVLAMYTDGHLASAEDARVQQLLTGMGVEPESDRNRRFDASVARVRRYSQTAAAASEHAATLASVFSSREQRQRVYDALDGLLASDKNISARESEFLTGIKETFQV